MPASPKKSRKWAGNAVARGAGKEPRSGPKRARSAPETAANCTYCVRKFGGELLTSTGLACAMERGGTQLVAAARKPLNKQNELKVTDVFFCLLYCVCSREIFVNWIAYPLCGYPMDTH